MAIKPITNKQLVSTEAINRANQTSTKNLENRRDKMSKILKTCTHDVFNNTTLQ